MEAVEDCRFSDKPWRTSVGAKFTYRVLIPSKNTVSRQFADLTLITYFVPVGFCDKDNFIGEDFLS
jgi:hypothetical protein